jgi:ribosomal protein S18 acetylase RimI-like enzyme
MINNTVVLKKVEDLKDAMILRNIRNDCRLFMTRDTSYITEKQQEIWFNNKPIDTIVYLLYLVELGVIINPIGYGLVRVDNNEYLISGGLSENYRGRGYGDILFSLLVNNINNKFPIKLELLKTNTRAFSVYNKLGFRVISDDGNIITMLYHYDSGI